MGDLILRNASYKKTAFSSKSDVIKFIEFDCAIGYKNSAQDNEVGKNEFTLKCNLNDGNLIPLGYYVAYGNIAEFAGKISERTIDLQSGTVTYYGLSIHSGAEGRVKRTLSDSGISSATYYAKTFKYDSSQIAMTIDNYQSTAGFNRKNKTEFYPKIPLDNVNLADAVQVIDKTYNLTASHFLIEKYIRINKRETHIEYRLGDLT